MIPSGNQARSAIESLATAILCSNNELPYYKDIKDNKFMASKAVSTVEKNLDKLGINEASFSTFKRHWKFYHNHSHGTLFSIASHISSSGSETALGSFFDKNKIPQYEKEFKSLTNLVRIIENFTRGIEMNFKGGDGVES
jgi:hypothetical protein